MNDMRMASIANGTAKQVRHPAPSEDLFRWLRSEVERVFDTMARPGELRPSSEALPALALDMTESDDTYRVTAELPGMKDDDVEVTLAGGVLTISGEKRQDEEHEEGGAMLRERRYGAFTRSIPLPEDADPAHVEARIKKGVLTIQVRKDEQAASRVRHIEVKKD